MDMPKPGLVHAKLLAFVGEWEGHEELFPSPWSAGGPAFGRMSFRGDLDGFAVIQEYIEQKDSKIVFRGHGVFTVEPHTDEVLWYWFDSYGFPPESPARGRFTGDVLALDRVTPRGASRHTYTITPNSCELSIESQFSKDAELRLFMKGKYARKDD